MKNLYLLRGLPGSGKSTLAEQLGGIYHGGVNQHGVPDEKLQQMQDRFEIKLK